MIGAGPAGLTAAYDLSRRGYKVTVYEELPEPGGMLRWAIPAYRLPREVLAREIDAIRATGVEIRCNTKVGKDVSFEKLSTDYDYIYIATGAHKSQRMNIEGEDLNGVYGSVEFLRDFNLNEEAWVKGKKQLGKKVVVIGGGNSAIDSARVALRLGAEVTILYRRERQDMPAAPEEIKAAEEEGVKIEFLVAPVKIIGQDGKVSAIVCQKMSLGDFDSSGRRRPVPIKGSEYTLPVDAVISAISQTPDLSFIPKESGVSINRWECVDLAPGSRSRTHNARIYAGGDVVTGPDTVIAAIAAGHQAAKDIDEAIRLANGEPPYEEPPEEKIEVPLIIDEETVESPQAAMPELHGAERILSFAEVELGFTKDEAYREACRCLRCDAEI
ncbi:MAG: FAD-dependent oxidoreductase [Syntrophales bacterium]|nr:FAD-dependent oxidoreductase [Syntrophales bacterium]